MRFMKFVAPAAAAMMTIGAGTAQAAPKVGDRLNFVACPMVRDTYVPAWLAQHEGELYYLGPQGDLGAEFHPPQLNHRALIEGVVTGEERISGGIVLSPVKAWVLPEIDVTCNIMLPAAGFPDPPHHRTPGPTNTEEDEPRPAPPQLALDKPQTFNIQFAFDVSDHLFSRYTRGISQAANFARDAKAEKVEVTGYRSAAVLSNGERLIEGDAIARKRAEIVAKMLMHVGVAEDLIEIKTRDAVQEADGVDDHLLRIAAITVRP